MSQEKEEKKGKSGGASRSRVEYQRGLPRLVIVKFVSEAVDKVLTPKT